MDRKRLNRINSVFSRLVIIFLIIIIPIYILGLYMYQWSLNTVKSEISKSAVAQASFYVEKLENEIERIKILQYDCLNDENLNKLAVRSSIMDYYDVVMSMKQLQQRLITINNSSEYISSVSVHILPVDKTISSVTGINDFDIQKFSQIRVPPELQGAQILRFNNGFYLSTLQEGQLAIDEPLFLIEVELDINVLKNELEQFNTYEGSKSMLVDPVNDDYISNASDLNQQFAESVISLIDFGQDDSVSSLFIDDDEYYMVNVRSHYLNMNLMWYIPVEYILLPLQHFNIWVWLFTSLSVFMIIIYSLYVYKTMHKPMKKLMYSFEEIETGNFNVYIKHDANNEFGYIYRRFNDMTDRLRTLIDQVYNQKILMQRAELKQLQSQINPHFLYNSMFMLNTMVRINDENLSAFTKYLGEYFRYITRNTSDYASLIDEIYHTKVYVKIQLIRFPKKLNVKIEKLPEQFNFTKVPRLVLQPIIENAFEHGIGGKVDNGVIVIRFDVRHEGFIYIIVEDNGEDLSDNEITKLQEGLISDNNLTEVTGIINIHRRIRLVYGENGGISIERSRLGGLKVVVKILTEGGVQNLSAFNR